MKKQSIATAYILEAQITEDNSRKAALTKQLELEQRIEECSKMLFQKRI